MFAVRNVSLLSLQLRKEDIDISVLNALPQEVRQEIIEEYKLEIASIKPEVKTVQKPPEKKSIFSCLSYEQMKQALKVWLQSEQKPGDFDVQMLGEYFRELAVDRKIGVLRDSLNFLHRYVLCSIVSWNFLCKFVFRNIGKQNCGLWHRAYFSVVNMAQEGMVTRYGNTLLVNRSFPCCTNC